VDWWGDEDIPPPGTVTEDLQVLSIPGSAQCGALAARCWEDGQKPFFGTSAAVDS